MPTIDRDLALFLAAGFGSLATIVLVLLAARLLEARYGYSATALDRQLERARERLRVAPVAQFARGIELQLPELAQHLRGLAALRALDLLLARAGSHIGMTGLAGLVAAMGITGLAGGLLLNLPWIGVMLLVLTGAAAPLLWLMRAAARRRVRFEAQFPEALDFIARALRAGHGLMAGLGMVASELRDPVAGEFGTVFEEVNFGAPVGEALARMAERVDSRDLDFFVVAVSIQRETGGNLAELLGGLANTVRERMKLAGKVRALSAEGRLSGVLMVVLPFVLGGVLSVINPEYMSLLWTTPEGRQAITVVLVMMLAGTLWIQMLVRIRV